MGGLAGGGRVLARRFTARCSSGMDGRSFLAVKQSSRCARRLRVSPAREGDHGANGEEQRAGRLRDDAVREPRREATGRGCKT